MFFREVAIVLWFDGPTFVAFDIVSLQNPFATQRGEALLDRARE